MKKILIVLTLFMVISCDKLEEVINEKPPLTLNDILPGILYTNTNEGRIQWVFDEQNAIALTLLNEESCTNGELANTILPYKVSQDGMYLEVSHQGQWVRDRLNSDEIEEDSDGNRYITIGTGRFYIDCI